MSELRDQANAREEEAARHLPESILSSQLTRALVDLLSPGALSDIDTATVRRARSTQTSMSEAQLGTRITDESVCRATSTSTNDFSRDKGSSASFRSILAATSWPTWLDICKQRSRSSATQLAATASTSGAVFFNASSFQDRLRHIFPVRGHLGEALNPCSRVTEKMVQLLEQVSLLAVSNRFLIFKDLTHGGHAGREKTASQPSIFDSCDSRPARQRSVQLPSGKEEPSVKMGHRCQKSLTFLCNRPKVVTTDFGRISFNSSRHLITRGSRHLCYPSPD